MKAMKKCGSVLLAAVLLLGSLAVPAGAMEAPQEQVSSQGEDSVVYEVPVNEFTQDFEEGYEEGFSLRLEAEYQAENPEPDFETDMDTYGDEPAPLPEDSPLQTDDHIVYINGSKDKFRPFDGLKRSEAAKIIYSLQKAPPQAGENMFTDVPDNKWYTQCINALAALGIIQGYGHEFRPENYITRAEFVTILFRLFPEEQGDMQFTDVPADYWAYDEIASAAAKGWIGGDPGGTFRPGDQIKRCEAVAVMNRVLGRKADKAKINAAGKILQYLDMPYSHWSYYDEM